MLVRSASGVSTAMLAVVISTSLVVVSCASPLDGYPGRLPRCITAFNRRLALFCVHRIEGCLSYGVIECECRRPDAL